MEEIVSVQDKPKFFADWAYSIIKEPKLIELESKSTCGSCEWYEENFVLILRWELGLEFIHLLSLKASTSDIDSGDEDRKFYRDLIERKNIGALLHVITLMLMYARTPMPGEYGTTASKKKLHAEVQSTVQKLVSLIKDNSLDIVVPGYGNAPKTWRSFKHLNVEVQEEGVHLTEVLASLVDEVEFIRFYPALGTQDNFQHKEAFFVRKMEQTLYGELGVPVNEEVAMISNYFFETNVWNAKSVYNTCDGNRKKLNRNSDINNYVGSLVLKKHESSSSVTAAKLSALWKPTSR